MRQHDLATWASSNNAAAGRWRRSGADGRDRRRRVASSADAVAKVGRGTSGLGSGDIAQRRQRKPACTCRDMAREQTLGLVCYRVFG